MNLTFLIQISFLILKYTHQLNQNKAVLSYTIHEFSNLDVLYMFLYLIEYLNRKESFVLQEKRHFKVKI